MPEENEILDDQSAEEFSQFVAEQLDSASREFVVRKRIYPKQLVPIMRALAAKTLVHQAQVAASNPGLINREDILMMPEPHYFAWSVNFYFPQVFHLPDLGTLEDIVLDQGYPPDLVKLWAIMRFYLLNQENDIVPLNPMGRKSILTAFPVAPRLVKNLSKWHRAVVKREDFKLVAATKDGNPHLVYQFGGTTQYDRPYFPTFFYRLIPNNIAQPFFSFFENEGSVVTKKTYKVLVDPFLNADFEVITNARDLMIHLSSNDWGLYYSLLPDKTEPERMGGNINVEA